MQGRPRLLPASRPRAVSVGRAPGARPAEPVPHGYRAALGPHGDAAAGPTGPSPGAGLRPEGASCHPQQQPQLVSAHHGARQRGRRHPGAPRAHACADKAPPYTSGPGTQAAARVRGESRSPGRPGASLHLLVTLTRLRSSSTSPAHLDTLMPPFGGPPVTTQGQGTPRGSRRPARRPPPAV